jgi:hypothetical protein
MPRDTWELTGLGIYLAVQPRHDFEEVMRSINEQAGQIADNSGQLTLFAPQNAQEDTPSNVAPGASGRGPEVRQGTVTEAYHRGLSEINRRQYDRAIAALDQVVLAKSARADAALYWKAVAQFRQRKFKEALATLGRLRTDYSQSGYLGDARVLEASVQRVSGQPANPAQVSDPHIKLLALQRMLSQKTLNIVPILDGVITGADDIEIKKLALFVLALSENPQAGPILLRYAKGGVNPELQVEAIRRLSSRGQRLNGGSDFLQIYSMTSEVNVKLEVIEALRTSLAAAEPPTIGSSVARAMETKSRAAVGSAEVLSLYQNESHRDLKVQIIGLLASMGAADQLAQIVLAEQDPLLRKQASRTLGDTRARPH